MLRSKTKTLTRSKTKTRFMEQPSVKFKYFWRNGVKILSYFPRHAYEVYVPYLKGGLLSLRESGMTPFFFQNSDYVSYKGVPYKTYCVYPSTMAYVHSFHATCRDLDPVPGKVHPRESRTFMRTIFHFSERMGSERHSHGKLVLRRGKEKEGRH